MKDTAARRVRNANASFPSELAEPCWGVGVAGHHFGCRSKYQDKWRSMRYPVSVPDSESSGCHCRGECSWPLGQDFGELKDSSPRRSWEWKAEIPGTEMGFLLRFIGNKSGHLCAQVLKQWKRVSGRRIQGVPVFLMGETGTAREKTESARISY